MKIPAFIPKPFEIGREALIVLGGSIVAAFIVSQSPRLQAWIKKAWNGTPHPYDLNG